MAASISRISIATPEAIESAVVSYVAQGYIVVERSAARAVLQKRKQFSALWTVVGLLLCVLLLFVYLIDYATQPEAWVVEIVVVPQAT